LSFGVWWYGMQPETHTSQTTTNSKSTHLAVIIPFSLELVKVVGNPLGHPLQQDGELVGVAGHLF
jgi:hypothetical protein